VSVAVAQVLEGVPEASRLRLVEVDGRRVVMLGTRALFAFDAGDLGMRNVAVVALTEMRFRGADVAALFSLTPTYVSELRGRVRDEGSAGLVRDRGRPRKLTAAQLEQAAAWRAQGWTDVQIGARLGVVGTTIGRRLGPASTVPDAGAGTAAVEAEPGVLDLGPSASGSEGGPAVTAAPEEQGPARSEPPVEVEPQVGTVGAGDGESGAVAGAFAPGGAFGLGPARIGQGVVACRWAGAMLVHAFTHRLGLTRILTDALGPGSDGARYDDVAVLAATSMAFTLGAGTVEGIKHLALGQAGALCAIARMPAVSTLRPRLAALADRVDPLAVQRALATALLAADPATSGVYYVDDHFVPYAGAKPVGKGWDTKHRRVARGRADTYVVDSRGRALVFTTGEPSSLTKTLPPALAQLRAVTGPEARILLGFDRGGAYPSVFTACRDAGADWVTYRRAPLPAPTRLPLAAALTPAGPATGYADEPVTIEGYGTARQITWFENGQVAMQVLTSDATACPVALLRTLKSRWRIENTFKYAAEYFGIDALADYLADIEVNTRLVDNPARKKATTAVTTAEVELAEAERALARLLADPTLTVTVKNEAIPTVQDRITRAQAALTAATATREAIPAKLPANEVDPDATRALLRTRRRALQMVLRLLAYNGEHYLATALNAYLRDDNEYRALTRATILRGTSGTITYTPDRIDVALDRPNSPRLTRALDLLLQEINQNPPRIPGDPRPITYQITPG